MPAAWPVVSQVVKRTYKAGGKPEPPEVETKDRLRNASSAQRAAAFALTETMGMASRLF
jgi:hypothetical protein